ncbi:GldG family protein [Pseudozobellia thermophila]|uniref:Gliding-associated putative ABC transporter substrate-binding component GldG n=1 Tax=Pseudozobellia thermophila TaxID=192903 RepID=A0A1M6CUD6_9FLAO|nr:Gldg family protein [Pseudozobellia thermophila]SHI64368.1 gliding-associated putative ABC transporter substrate-binding component GldG [Pseudozobellia thermophila]
MKKTNITLVLIIAILVFANLVSKQYFFRLDLTEDKQYTLSDATENIMASLENPITVKAYFSENLPPDIAKTKNDFEEYLIEYARHSDDNLIYTFINPNEKESLEREAMEAGINPVMINVREKDQMKQQKAFLGAVLQLEDRKEVIPFVQPGAPLEYLLSSSIKKIAVTDKPEVGLLQGYGQATIGELAQVKTALDVLYNFKSVTVNDSVAPPENIRTLALVRPTDTISAGTLKQLDTFLENGGNLFIALNRVNGDLNSSYGSALGTGLEKWLDEKGLEVAEDFVIDAQCATVSVQQRQGFFNFTSNIAFPYAPIISKFADHPSTKGLDGVVMQFASSLKFTAKDSLTTFTPLAFSSENSGSLAAPQFFNLQKEWTNSDFSAPNQVVAGVLEQTHPNGKRSRIFVVSDGDFPVGNGQQPLQADNVNLMVNAIDWLSDDTGLIDLRTKGIQYRPLDKLEEGTKTTLKYVNFLLPIVLVMAYGIVRMQMNNSKRSKRLEENYE